MTAHKRQNDENPSKPEPFGEMVPFGDPSNYQEWYSPYYKSSHFPFRKALREFVENEIMPFVYEWDEVSFPLFYCCRMMYRMWETERMTIDTISATPFHEMLENTG